MPTHTLYLCYFGLREPLVQTQVLPYLRQLVSGGVRVSLLTFEPQLEEKWTEKELESERARLKAEGISWHCREYHKRPSLPATLYDAAVGALLSRRLIRREGVQVLHARAHVPALMAAIAKRIGGGSVRMVFDIRGFMLEEYTDAGVWPAGGYLYRGAKRVERFLLASADAFVVLTRKAREILFPGATDADMRGRPVEVIPCCVDMRRFQAADASSREQLRAELGLTDRRVVVYVGALGGWYLTAEMADLLAVAHEEDAKTFSCILTQSEPEAIAAPLRARGISDSDFLIRKVEPRDIPRYLGASDIAISFIKPCYSKLSSSPTKLAEYLASGLPVICNTGIGDVDEVVEGERVGVLVREFKREAYRAALLDADALRREAGAAARCRAAAVRHFDLERVGGERYRRLYRRLMRDEGT